jgi:hypothetical protein
MLKALRLLILFFAIISCKNEPSSVQDFEPINSEKSLKQEEKIEETIYLFGSFDGKVRACTTCEGYQKTHTWITRIVEFKTLNNLVKEKKMDSWENKLRQIFPGVKIINRISVSNGDYFIVSQKRRDLLNEEGASSTDALRGF